MEQETKETQTRTEEQLWNDAKSMDKFNFLTSLEGKSRGLWISVIVLFIAVVIVYFVVPAPFPPIEHIEYFKKQNIVIATNKNDTYIINTNKNILEQSKPHGMSEVRGVDSVDGVFVIYDLKSDVKLTLDNNSEPTQIPVDEGMSDVVIMKHSHGDRYFFTGDSLTVEYDHLDSAKEYTKLGYIRVFMSAVYGQDKTWIADYDRIFPVDFMAEGDRFITPRKDKPIKHLAAIDDKILIIYEDGMLLEINPDGKITDKKKIAAWTGYNKVSDIEGETIVSGIGHIIQIGNVHDADPEKTFDLRELTK